MLIKVCILPTYGYMDSKPSPVNCRYDKVIKKENKLLLI